jgi:hypothetical protein
MSEISVVLYMALVDVYVHRMKRLHWNHLVQGPRTLSESRFTSPPPFSRPRPLRLLACVCKPYQLSIREPTDHFYYN